jgi:hypothetical protein
MTLAPGRARAAIAVALVACAGRGIERVTVEQLQVEIAPGVDPRLSLEVRESSHQTRPDHSLGVGLVVTNRGEVTFRMVDVSVELVDEGGAVVGSQRVPLVGMESSLPGSLDPGFQAARWWGGWSRDWGRPETLRARVVAAEVVRGEPPPPPPTPRPAPVQLATPLPAGTDLDLQMLWGGDGPEGIGPSAGRVAFDVQLAVTNRGTTTVSWLAAAAVFLDAAGNEVDRLALNGSFSPPLRPGDRRTFGAARGVIAHASWHITVGAVTLE